MNQHYNIEDASKHTMVTTGNCTNEESTENVLEQLACEGHSTEQNTLAKFTQVRIPGEHE
jgi:hypothetical protein